MEGRVRVCITVDRRVWEAFMEKVASERGVGSVGEAVGEALEEELVELLVLEALDSLEAPGEVGAPPAVEPVEPREPVDAGETVGGAREDRVSSVDG